jgi:hypothetical protein
MRLSKVKSSETRVSIDSWYRNWWNVPALMENERERVFSRRNVARKIAYEILE